MLKKLVRAHQEGNVSEGCSIWWRWALPRWTICFGLRYDSPPGQTPLEIPLRTRRGMYALDKTWTERRRTFRDGPFVGVDANKPQKRVELHATRLPPRRCGAAEDDHRTWGLVCFMNSVGPRVVNMAAWLSTSHRSMLVKTMGVALVHGTDDR